MTALADLPPAVVGTFIVVFVGTIRLGLVWIEKAST